MGDVPSMERGETREAYQKRCLERRGDFFSDIACSLRESGGTVLYVVQDGRLDDAKAGHLQAMNAVVRGCFSTAVALVITRVPSGKSKEEATLQAYLRQQRATMEVGRVSSALCGSGLGRRGFCHARTCAAAQRLRPLLCAASASVSRFWRLATGWCRGAAWRRGSVLSGQSTALAQPRADSARAEPCASISTKSPRSFASSPPRPGAACGSPRCWACATPSTQQRTPRILHTCPDASKGWWLSGLLTCHQALR